MRHKVTGFRCDYRGHDLVITAQGASPRGTKVLLGRVIVPSFNPREAGNKGRVLAALERFYPDERE